MSGNTFGRLFCVSTFGESHGQAIGCIVDGCPPGIPLSEDVIQEDLARRRPGSSPHVTQRRETDKVEILSGIYENLTTGTPIGMLIRNVDAKSRDYDALRDVFRPGHADYTYFKKYGRRDHRGGGRASARETAARVAAGSVARQVLNTFGITVRGRLAMLGDIAAPLKSWSETARNPFFSANSDVVPAMKNKINQLRRDGDSCGAIVEAEATGMTAGWGEPVFDRLDADIAKALMSINAVKGVEIGAGFTAAAQTGSVHSDEILADGFASNHAGGVLGGISTGQDIVVRLAIKPTSSIRLPRRTINKNGEETTVTTQGRHDPCVGIRAVPVAEAMLALTLADHALRHRGQCGIFPPC